MGAGTGAHSDLIQAPPALSAETILVVLLVKARMAASARYLAAFAGTLLAADIQKYLQQVLDIAILRADSIAGHMADLVQAHQAALLASVFSSYHCLPTRRSLGLQSVSLIFHAHSHDSAHASPTANCASLPHHSQHFFRGHKDPMMHAVG